MFALVLAVAAIAPASPDPLAASCDPGRLQALVSKQQKDTAPILMDLDQHIAAALFEQRKEQSELDQSREQDRAAATQAERLRLPLAAAMLAGLALVIVAGRRKQSGLAVAGALLVAGAGAVGWRAASQVASRAEGREASVSHIHELASCRTRLVEARATVEHGRLARCLYDIGEFDEDVRGWLVKMRDGETTITLQQLEHMEQEMRDATK